MKKIIYLDKEKLKKISNGFTTNNASRGGTRIDWNEN